MFKLLHLIVIIIIFPQKEDMEMQKLIVKISELEKDNEQLRNLCRRNRKVVELTQCVRFTSSSADQSSVLQESQRVKKLYSSGVTPRFHTLNRSIHSSNKENTSHSYRTSDDDDDDAQHLKIN